MPGIFLQIGMESVRVDIVSRLKELDFEEAWQRRMIVQYGSVDTFVISKGI